MTLQANSSIKPRSFWVALLAVLALALLLRAGFALTVTRSLAPETFRNVHGDTNGYAKIGDNLYLGEPYAIRIAGARDGETMADSKYVFEVNRNRARALARPPGYPAYYAAMRFAGFDLRADLRPIVWPQVAMSALLVGAIFWAAYGIFGHVTAATVAGALGAVSPTAIASASVATADSLYSALFGLSVVAYLALLAFGTTRRHRVAWAIASGLLLAVAVLLKPAAMYWPLFAVPLLVVARGVGLATWRDAALVVVPLIVVVAAWTAFNASRENLATYSTIATRNLRWDVVPRVELAARSGRLPTKKEYRKEADRVTGNFNRALRSRDVDIAALHRQMSGEIRNALVAHPLIAGRVFASNLAEQMTTGWLWIDDQIPGSDPLSRGVRWTFKHTDREVPLVLWYAGVLAAVPLCLLRRDRRALMPLVACAMVVGYVALGTITVRGEGSRLVAAGDPMCWLLISGTLCYVGDIIKHRLGPVSSLPAGPSTPAA